MTVDETIRDLYKYQMDIKKSDSASIDYETSVFYCYIKKHKDLSKIFDKKVAAYKKLRENPTFQDAVMKFFRSVKKNYKKFDYNIYSYEYFTPLPILTLKNSHKTKQYMTLLYLYNVDNLLNKLLPQQKKFINEQDIRLIDRNILIYCYYAKHSTNTLLRDMHSITSRAGIDYSFYFFDLEKRQLKIKLIEQMKIASNDIIKCFIEELRRENKPNQDTRIIKEKYELTRREREIYSMLQIENYTASEIADRLSISPRTVENHINHILFKTGVSTKKAIKIKNE